jgi:hypothetical protein
MYYILVVNVMSILYIWILMSHSFVVNPDMVTLFRYSLSLGENSKALLISRWWYLKSIVCHPSSLHNQKEVHWSKFVVRYPISLHNNKKKPIDHIYQQSNKSKRSPLIIYISNQKFVVCYPTSPHNNKRNPLIIYISNQIRLVNLQEDI